MLKSILKTERSKLNKKILNLTNLYERVERIQKNSLIQKADEIIAAKQLG